MYKDHEPEIKVDLYLSSFMQAGVICSLMPGPHLSSKMNLVLSASLVVLSQQSWFQTATTSITCWPIKWQYIIKI